VNLFKSLNIKFLKFETKLESNNKQSVILNRSSFKFWSRKSSDFGENC